MKNAASGFIEMCKVLSLNKSIQIKKLNKIKSIENKVYRKIKGYFRAEGWIN